MNSEEQTIPFVRAKLLPLKPRNETEAQAYGAKIHALKLAAAADEHIVIAPTHVMVKPGPDGQTEIVGYLSINGMPTVHAWFDSKNPRALDSLKMIEHGETICREGGLAMYCVACAAESPFTPHLPRLGFEKLGVTTLWVKKL